LIFYSVLVHFLTEHSHAHCVLDMISVNLLAVMGKRYLKIAN